MADGAGWGATTFTSALRVIPTRSWRTKVMPPTVVAITNIPNRMAHARAIRSSTMARIIRHPPADQLGPYIATPTCLINVYLQGSTDAPKSVPVNPPRWVSTGSQSHVLTIDRRDLQSPGVSDAAPRRPDNTALPCWAHTSLRSFRRRARRGRRSLPPPSNEVGLSY